MRTGSSGAASFVDLPQLPSLSTNGAIKLERRLLLAVPPETDGMHGTVDPDSSCMPAPLQPQRFFLQTSPVATAASTDSTTIRAIKPGLRLGASGGGVGKSGGSFVVISTPGEALLGAICRGEMIGTFEGTLPLNSRWAQSVGMFGCSCTLLMQQNIMDTPQIFPCPSGAGWQSLPGGRLGFAAASPDEPMSCTPRPQHIHCVRTTGSCLQWQLHACLHAVTVRVVTAVIAQQSITALKDIH